MTYELETKLKEVFARSLEMLKNLCSCKHSLEFRSRIGTGLEERVYGSLYDLHGNMRYEGGAPVYSEMHLAGFELSALPGDGDVVVSHDSFVQQWSRGNGIGGALNALRVTAASDAGASCMLCTVRSDNEPERKILFNNGWKQMGGYIPKHARGADVLHKYAVEFWMKEL